LYISNNLFQIQQGGLLRLIRRRESHELLPPNVTGSSSSNSVNPLPPSPPLSSSKERERKRSNSVNIVPAPQNTSPSQAHSPPPGSSVHIEDHRYACVRERSSHICSSSSHFVLYFSKHLWLCTTQEYRICVVSATQQQRRRPRQQQRWFNSDFAKVGEQINQETDLRVNVGALPLPYSFSSLYLSISLSLSISLYLCKIRVSLECTLLKNLLNKKTKLSPPLIDPKSEICQRIQTQITKQNIRISLQSKRSLQKTNNEQR
jgi:hypothetical protein